MTKKQLGQFFTTNSDYILQGFEKYIGGKNITDPFAGNQDLLNWAEKYNPKSIKGYDIDEKYIDSKTVFKNDSLSYPLEYEFVLTNPPYLYVNKMETEQKTVFANTKAVSRNNLIICLLFIHLCNTKEVLKYIKYSQILWNYLNKKILCICTTYFLTLPKHTDLYQISLEKIMNCKEGIAIVPVNFLSANNAKYIREIFLSKFEIKEINFFTEQVFPDTTYTVIAFYFVLKQGDTDSMAIPIKIFPDEVTKHITIEKKYNWQIGGEFLSKINNQKNVLGIKRLVENDLQEGSEEIKLAHNHLKNIQTYKLDTNTTNKIRQNIILLKAIDTGSKGGEICLEDIRKYDIEGLISIPTSRNQIFLLFENQITIKEQEELIYLFNKTINEAREKYFSLFMTNYRDKNRKRISFNFAYKLINYLYSFEL